MCIHAAIILDMGECRLSSAADIPASTAKELLKAPVWGWQGGHVYSNQLKAQLGTGRSIFRMRIWTCSKARLCSGGFRVIDHK